ncbi:MAG TPA: hypothetical protein P5048_01595 [Chlamydiales bacterium]|nr:hypothetical protein [Chlamydiales bacterium]
MIHSLKKLSQVIFYLPFIIYAESSNVIDAQEFYTSQNAPEFKTAFFKMLGILFFIIILIIATYIVLKKMMKTRIHTTNQLSQIKILEKRVLSPKTILYLVESNGQKSLISESHLEVKRIDNISKEKIHSEKDKNV